MSQSPPQRIVSLLASATEILYGLGLGERVVGISHECDFPVACTSKPRVTRCLIDDQQSSQQIDEEVTQLASEGRALYQIDEEALSQLRPDVIVTQAQCDVCAVRYQDVVDLVSQNSILQQTAVVAMNPMSLDEILEDVAMVGRAVQCAAEAVQYVAALRARLDAVADRIGKIPIAQRPRVACVEWIEPMMLAANWMPQVVELAGGHNGLTSAGQHSGYANWSDVVDYDPEVMFVCPCGFDVPRTLIESRSLLTQPGWNELTAVRTGRVFAVDGNAYLNRAGPRIVDSLEILAHLLHPTLCNPPTDLPDTPPAWQQMKG